MSTYYSFKCDNCKLLGGFMSQQAWGTGNADLIDNFKFVMFHSLECGTGYIGVVSEHEQEYDDYEDTNLSGEIRCKHLEDTRHIMPSSSDWQFITNHQDKEWAKVKDLWVDSELGEASNV